MIKFEYPKHLKDQIRENLSIITVLTNLSKKDIMGIFETSQITFTAYEKGEKYLNDAQFFVFSYYLATQLKTNNKLYAYLNAVSPELVMYCTSVFNDQSLNQFRTVAPKVEVVENEAEENEVQTEEISKEPVVISFI